MFFTLKKNLIANSLQLGYVLILISSIFYSLAHVIAKPLLDNTSNNDSITINDSTLKNTVLEEFNEIGLFFSALDNVDVINPAVLSAMVYLINALLFTLITKRKKNEKCQSFISISKFVKRSSSKNMLLLSLIGIVEILALVVYYFGLKDSSAINASIFSNSETLFSFLIVMVVFRERLSKNELMPFAMIVVGIIVLPLGYGVYENQMNFSDMLMGDFLILLSGLLYAVDVCLCRYVSNKIDSKRFVQITSLSSGLFALLVVFVFQIPFFIDLNHLPVIVVLSVIGTGFSTLFFIMALRLLGGIRTIVLYSTTAIFGIIFSGAILAEKITLVDVSSIIFTIVGIYFLRNKLGVESKEKKKERIGFT
ncbi:MAG: DMT family transporter [Nitrosopumilus sp.]